MFVKIIVGSEFEMFRFLVDEFINLDEIKFLFLGISYDQNHWFPVAFIMFDVFGNSSVIYKINKDGKEMNINIKSGIDVQKISDELFSVLSYSFLLFKMFDIVQYEIMIIFRIKIMLI